MYDFTMLDSDTIRLECNYIFSKFADWNNVVRMESEDEKMKRVANEFMGEIKYAPRFLISK